MRGEQTTKARMKALLTELKIYPGRGHSEILFSALAEERAQIVADIADFG